MFNFANQKPKSFFGLQVFLALTILSLITLGLAVYPSDAAKSTSTSSSAPDAPAVLPTLSINDVTVTEGSGGVVIATLKV